MQTKELVYVSSCQSPSLRFGCSHTHTHTCTVSSNTYTPHKFIDAHVSPDAFGRPHPQVETYSHGQSLSSKALNDTRLDLRTIIMKKRDKLSAAFSHRDKGQSSNCVRSRLGLGRSKPRVIIPPLTRPLESDNF